MKDLSDEQIEILYINYMDSPGDEDLKYSYYHRTKNQEKADELRKNLEDNGTPKEVIDKIVEEYIQNEHG